MHTMWCSPPTTASQGTCWSDEIHQFFIIREKGVAGVPSLVDSWSSYLEVLRIAKGCRTCVNYSHAERRWKKSISNEIVLEWSSQESNGWETPKDAVSFCQKVKEDVPVCFYKARLPRKSDALGINSSRVSHVLQGRNGLWTFRCWVLF